MTTGSDHDGRPVVDAGTARSNLEQERRRVAALLADVVGSEDLDEPAGSSPGGEISTEDQHPADFATETQYREQSLAEAEQLRAELEEIGAAFVRLDDGSYGRCTACGRPIGEERLRSLPATRFCIDDARAAEAEAVRPAETPEAG